MSHYHHIHDTFQQCISRARAHALRRHRMRSASNQPCAFMSAHLTPRPHPLTSAQSTEYIPSPIPATGQRKPLQPMPASSRGRCGGSVAVGLRRRALGGRDGALEPIEQMGGRRAAAARVVAVDGELGEVVALDV